MHSLCRSISIDAMKTLINVFIQVKKIIATVFSIRSQRYNQYWKQHLKDVHVWSDYSNHQRCAALAADSVTIWLFVNFMTVYRAMHHIAPICLTELCIVMSIHQDCAHLCSTGSGDLSLVVNEGTTYCRRSFAVSGLTTWNTLSLSTRVCIARHFSNWLIAYYFKF